MAKTAVQEKPKRELTEEHKAKLRNNMAKARVARDKNKVVVQPLPDAKSWDEVRERLGLEPETPQLAVTQEKPKQGFRLFAKKPKQAIVETISAIVVDAHTIGDGVVQVEKSKLPSGAFQILYLDRWVYPLVEVAENGQLRYEPWPLMDPKDDDESKLPPETLGMATDWPEARLYYSQGKNANAGLNIALAIGLLVGLGILFFLIFTIGMG